MGVFDFFRRMDKVENLEHKVNELESQIQEIKKTNFQIDQSNKLEEELKDIEQRLDKSSDTNTRLGITFLIFLFYIQVLVSSTTNLQLFLPDSEILLPVFNVPTHILTFYSITPIIVLIFHFIVIFHLYLHRLKIDDREKVFNDLNINQPQVEKLRPNFVNCLFIRPNDEHRLFILIVNSVSWAIIFLAPLYLLFNIQTEFSKYQNFNISFYHASLVILDIVVLSGFWDRIFLENPSNKNTQTSASSPKMYTRQYYLHWFKKISTEILHRMKYFVIKKPILTTFSIMTLFNLLNLYLIIFQDKIIDRYPFEMYLTLNREQITKQKLNRLEINNLMNIKNNNDLNSDITGSVTENEIYLKALDPLKISNRNLKFIRMAEAEIFNVEFENVNINRADLSFAIFHKFHFRSSSIKSVIIDLSCASCLPSVPDIDKLTWDSIQNEELKYKLYNKFLF